MKKREIFLYFSHKGKGFNGGGHTVTSTEVGTTWAASSGDVLQNINIAELFDGANKGTVGSITEVTVESAVDATGVRGSDYTATPASPGGKFATTAADVVVGQVTVLAAASYAATLGGSAGSEEIKIKKLASTAASTGSNDHGYNLAAGDIVRVKRALKEGEAVVYPADMLIGCSFVDDNNTKIHFNSMKGEENDDVITVTHGTGKFKEVADLVKACAESNPYKAGMIKVIDLFSDPNIVAGHNADDLGITNCVISIANN